MEVLLVVLLSICAFILGGCPFSVWIGRIALNKDIRNYGDGNPGSSNVFKAGSKKWGILALVLDILKGVPFVLAGKLVFGLPQPLLYIIALCAVLGHAYSPFLGFRGGKALAVFAGTLFGLGQWDMVLTLIILLIIGFMLIGNDAWTVILSMAGALVVLFIIRADIWEVLFMSCVGVLYLIKHFQDLRIPGHEGRLVHWLRSRRKAA